MNCADAEELLGAYALDALPDSAAAAMRAHVAQCENHAAKAAELRAVALELPALADPIAAPPQLRARVLDAVARDAGARDAGAREAAQPQTPRSIRAAAAAPANRVQWRPSNVRSLSPAWGALAAAILIAFGGLLSWNIVLQNRDTGGLDQLATRAPSVAQLKPASGGGGGTVVYFAADKKALVISEGLGQLDASTQTYQMWAVDGDNMKSIGLMLPDDNGHAAAVVPFDAARTGAIAVTIEPAGGSPQPTTQPILTATCLNPTTPCTS